MDPTKWGPGLWIFLHTLTFNYPSNPTWTEKKIMNDYLTQLQYVLPCIHCRSHYKDYLLNEPPKLESRSEFVVWMIQLHNDVNKRNNKPLWSVDKVVEFYKKFYDNTIQLEFKENKKENWDSLFKQTKTLKIIVFVSLFWLLLYYIISYHKKPFCLRK
jgi:hypothetical protein